MTDDIVARSPDAATRRLPDFIRTLRINREKRRESVYASDNVYALLDALDAAEARVRELEAELYLVRNERDNLDDNCRRLQGELSDAYERAAKCAEGCDLPERGWMPGSLYDTIRCEVAAAIRGMGKESRK